MSYTEALSDMLTAAMLGGALYATTAIAAPAPVQVTGYTQQHAHCIARAIYHEARSQSPAGQIAVAQVVLNRAASGRFPSDPCDVIYQRVGGRCQFSWACTPIHNQHPKDQEAYGKAFQIAQASIGGLPDLTGGATYFHDTSINGWRHLRPVARIDRHIFYREP